MAGAGGLVALLLNINGRGGQSLVIAGVGIGKDDTLFAKAEGFLEFTENRRGRVVNVISADAQAKAEADRETAAAASSSK